MAQLYMVASRPTLYTVVEEIASELPLSQNYAFLE